MKNSPSQSRYIDQAGQSGFTLVELVMVIIVMGIIGSVVAVFMKGPIDAYFASARRAAMTDVADTAVRRISRDLHKALPNSIRQINDQCIEFIPTKTGGRYRAEVDAAGGDILDFTKADGSFNMLGLNSALPVDQRITSTTSTAPADVIVVYNLGIPGSDAYVSTGPTINTAEVTSVGGTGTTATETNIGISPRQFPLESGSKRFHVIPGNERVVSFVCPTAGQTAVPGNLVRYANYSGPASVSATTACPSTGGSILATNATCTFTYSGPDLQRNALVQMTITLTDNSGESVSLYHEVHVDNTP